MPHVLERCLHGGFWAATVNPLSRSMAGFGLLAWSVIDNAAPAGGALTGALATIINRHGEVGKHSAHA